MNKIIGHIVGLDEIHKKKLIKELPSHIKIIDLDHMQQSVYNSDDIIKEKNKWNQLANDIMVKRKQLNLIGGESGSGSNDKIKKLLEKKNFVRKTIHSLWKDNLMDIVNEEISNVPDDNSVLLVGFNIFPKDYRIKINLPMSNLAIDVNGVDYANKLIFDISPNKYAANQIKFYLKTYGEKIINGTFPLNLLKIDYLATKYEKFTQFYENLGYVPVQQDDLLEVIRQLGEEQITFENLSNKNIFIATVYKSGDSIPINGKTPIEGFQTKTEAIENIKSKMKKDGPVYLYQINPDQFSLINGKLVATQELYPIEEESMLLTV